MVVALPLAVLSFCHPHVNSPRQLLVASPLFVLSLCPVPPSHPLIAPAGCCASSRCATLSSSRRHVVPPLVVLLRQLVVAPSSLIVLSLHRPLVLSSCWLLVALPVLAPPSPLNAACRHRTPPPPSSLNAVSIVHRCHSCHPSPPSNANAHLRPSPLSNADARRRLPCHRLSVAPTAVTVESCPRH